MTSDEQAAAVERVRVRRLRPGEGAWAAKLAADSPTAGHWSAADYEAVAAEAKAVPPLDVAGEAKAANNLCLVAENVPGAPCGFLHARTAGGEAELLNIVVARGRRRQGIATALFDEANRQLKERGAAALWLEVRESNAAAIAFYRARGFAERGRRKAYYRNPPEDALILCRDLSGRT